ncbi:MAG: hypothetical protein EOP06_11975, partial [Proteobacteria bacterium]
IKDAYIEYIPYKAKDKKTVRSYPELESSQEVGFWDTMINALADYFPFLAKYSDTVVNSIKFDVKIEPETQAKIVLPKGISDIEGRLLSNAIAEFHIRVGAMTEAIRIPQTLSFFEKLVPNVSLPIAIVNQHQKLTIRKSGTSANSWKPVQDVASMIRLVRAYATRGEYREEQEYTSPLEQLRIPHSKVQQTLSGPENRLSFLSFPFAATGKTPDSGMYAIEISSPTLEAAQSDASEKRFYNPRYVLAQVTDIAVHLKRGEHKTLAWVTRLSNAQPVPGAKVSVYNCVGQEMQTLTADASGLVTFQNQKWAKDCQNPKDAYAPVLQPDQFYIAASSGHDQALMHSSWASSSSYALGAPGVEYFYSDMEEDAPTYHAIVGVNLVKPGQKVPVQIVAKVPNSQGFADVSADKLPSSARVVSNEDDDVYFDFPLTWKNGTAELTWQVPQDGAVRRLHVDGVAQPTTHSGVQMGLALLGHKERVGLGC